MLKTTIGVPLSSTVTVLGFKASVMAIKIVTINIVSLVCVPFENFNTFNKIL